MDKAQCLSYILATTEACKTKVAIIGIQYSFSEVFVSLTDNKIIFVINAHIARTCQFVLHCRRLL